MKVFSGFVGLFLFVFIAQAESLYIEQMQNYSADEKTLEEARKQIKAHQEIVIKQDIFVPAFHKQRAPQSPDKKEFCNNCHLSSPHRENERKRSFLNMHARYISCLTCHFQPENTRLQYRWLPFDEKQGELAVKRIAPFYEGKAVPVFSDDEMTKQLVQDWDTKSASAKAKLKAKLHGPLSKQGPDCVRCHDKRKQLLDLSALDYSEKEIKNLQQHAIPRFFGRFSKDDQRLRMTDLLP